MCDDIWHEVNVRVDLVSFEFTLRLGSDIQMINIPDQFRLVLRLELANRTTTSEMHAGGTAPICQTSFVG